MPGEIYLRYICDVFVYKIELYQDRIDLFFERAGFILKERKKKYIYIYIYIYIER